MTADVIILPVVRVERGVNREAPRKPQRPPPPLRVDDAVQLKSGGPVMTVMSPPENREVFCAWPMWSGGRVVAATDVFNEARLYLIYRPPPPGAPMAGGDLG